MWGSDGLQLTQFTPTPMTLTERNQRLYDLRKALAEAQVQVAWIETQIMATNQQYKDAQRGDLRPCGRTWTKFEIHGGGNTPLHATINSVHTHHHEVRHP